MKKELEAETLAENDIVTASDAGENREVNIFKRHVFIIGDREIIGSTPKNPVIMRIGG